MPRMLLTPFHKVDPIFIYIFSLTQKQLFMAMTAYFVEKSKDGGTTSSPIPQDNQTLMLAEIISRMNELLFEFKKLSGWRKWLHGAKIASAAFDIISDVISKASTADTVNIIFIEGKDKPVPTIKLN